MVKRCRYLLIVLEKLGKVGKLRSQPNLSLTIDNPVPGDSVLSDRPDPVQPDRSAAGRRGGGDADGGSEAAAGGDGGYP